LEKAYVLLVVEMWSEKEVLNALDEIPDVKEAYQIHGMQSHGVYDLIIRVEAETIQELKDLINKRIRNIKKIGSMLLLTCIKEGDIQVGIGKKGEGDFS